MSTEKLLLSRTQAAQLLGISLRKVAYLIAEKRLPVTRIGRRVLVVREELERFAREGMPADEAMPERK